MDPLHFSQLKRMAQSPAHYQYGLGAPNKQNASLRKGSAVDELILKSAVIGKGVVICDMRRDPRTKAYQEFLLAHPDDIILNAAEAEHVAGCADAIRSNTDAWRLLQGERQQTISWSIGDRSCEGTPDVFTRDRVVELKTTRSADPNRFKWDARRFAYHAQLAWYSHALLQSGLAKPQAAFVVAVETVPPYPVTCFQLSEQALDLGERTWRLWLERLLVCEQCDEWPEYAQSIVELDFGEPEEGFSLTIGGEEVEL